MKAIEVWDLRGPFFLTLEEVFSALSMRARGSLWEVSDFLYPGGEEPFFVGGDGDNRIGLLANTEQRIGGAELARLAKTTSQVIWGTFRGYEDDGSEPWIAVHAIDSTYWRIETGEIATRQKVMKSFRDVRLSD